MADRDPKIEAIVQHADHGFWNDVEKFAFSPKTLSQMPRACDRFYEARHFIQLIRDLPATDESIDLVNWYLGAHVTAAIAIRDAGKNDFEVAQVRTEATQKFLDEFYLKSGNEGPAIDRDPAAINRNYRFLRNLRTHRAEKLIVLEQRMLREDYHFDEPARKRWFLRQITREEYQRIIRNPHDRDLKAATLDDVERFNTYSEKGTVVAIASQHLGTLARLIESTARNTTLSRRRVPVLGERRPKRTSCTADLQHHRDVSPTGSKMGF